MKNFISPLCTYYSSTLIKFTLVLIGLILLQPFNAKGQTWNPVDISEITLQTGTRDIIPNKFQLYQVDDDQIKTILDAAPTEEEKEAGNLTPADNAIIKLGLPDGESEEFLIYEYKMMEAGLASLFPEFKTYYGTSISNPNNHVRIDYTAHGLRAMIISPEGNIFIDHYQRNDKNHKVVYYKKDYSKPITWFCGVTGNGYTDKDKNNAGSRIGDCGIRHIYRIAVAATGEYTTFHGGTLALGLAAIMTTMNRVNGVFEREAAVRMILVGNNNLIIYTNAATDPYTNGDPGLMIDENQANIDAVIGNANYDIGHVFGTNSGGLAGLGVTCATGVKALGVTGSSAPIGDPFDIDYVAHEIGHQFNANHTQYNNCNRNDPTSVEPGSASTIMGYAGICPPDVQSNSNDYFSTASLYEIRPFVVSNGCDIEVVLTNSAPTVSPLSNYSIPASTPFFLTASATDPNGSLTYCWEQIDIFTGTLRTMPPAATNIDGPMFRSLTPVASPTRYFPNLPDVLNNVNPTWEELPSIGRPMNFRVTVRDNFATAGCTGEAQNVVTTIAGTGPFLVTSPNTAVTYTGNSSQTITWDVAGTTAAPISCANVNILLTTDGGATFTTLASNTPNDGSQSVTIPNISTSTARVWVQCANNIFYDVSNANFTILPAVAECSTVFFSEYIEGTSNNKAVEIYNPTSSTITLTGNASVRIYFNGSPTVGNTINLTGTIAPNDVFVLANNSANASILAQADQTSGSLTFNGDDAVELVFSSVTADVIGQIGFDPGTEWGTGLTSTADNTIRRKSTITVGDNIGSNVFDPSIEWDGFATDNSTGLGSHTSDCQVTCPDFANFTPNNVTIINSTCQTGCMVIGGTLSIIDNCPAGSTMQFSVNGGMSWSNILPVYLQNGPSQTIITRCSCDDDNNINSTESQPVSTIPGSCIIPGTPVIEINNNICPSTEGGISATGCNGPNEILEWSLDNMTWTNFAPFYDGSSFTVYARCRNTVTGCIGEVATAQTQPEICEDCPLIIINSVNQECTDIGVYNLTVCFSADILFPEEEFLVEIGGTIYGPYLYSDYETANMGEYCITITDLISDGENNIPVFINHLGIPPSAPVINGSSVIDTEWGNPYVTSDGVTGWAGVNVGDLYITSDVEYFYFGVNLNAAANWQSWGFAINTLNGPMNGGADEVWNYQIDYGHAELPDYVIKGNFTGYAEIRQPLPGGGNNPVLLNLPATDFAANPNGMIEVRVLKSTFGFPGELDVQFYVSGNNGSEHATFDAVPDDQVAISWNHNGQNGNPPPTILDNYAPTFFVESNILCSIDAEYNEVPCIECPDLSPITADVQYCVGDISVPLTAQTNYGGNLVWYDEIPDGNVTPLPGAPTPGTTNPGTTTYYVTEEVGGCESPYSTITVTVGQIDIISVIQNCTTPGNFDLNICFSASNQGSAQQFSIFINGQQFGPFDYADYQSEGNYCILIEDAGITTPLEEVTVIVKDEGDVVNATPVLNGTFDGTTIWGNPVAVADQTEGWAGANARNLYITQDDTYFYIGAEVTAQNWQSWAFLINSKPGGGISDSWSRQIDYVHTNAPDYVFRGTFGGYSEFHTWNGMAWTGYSQLPNSEYGVSTSWVETRILKSAVGNPSQINVQFFITGNENAHGSFDAVPDDDNAVSWDESGNRTQLNNYAPAFILEGPGSAMCMDMYTFLPQSCGNWFISDPCVCNNNATVSGNDGTFNEVITVNGPAGQIVTGTCTGCTPSALTFTEGPAGTYISNTFTHVDNLGYVATLFSGGMSFGTIGNKCAYPDVTIDPFGPVANCINSPDFPLTATVVGDDGSGTYVWSGTGVSGTNFNPAGLTPGNYNILVQYDGVDNGNVSPDGGITPAYPGCIQPAAFDVVVEETVSPPDIDDITVCEGESTLIMAGTITTPVGSPVSVTYNFEGDNPAATTTNNMFATGANASIGTGISGLSFPAGCGSLDAMSANNWSQPDETSAVANNDYFEFVVTNSSLTNTLVISGFSFSGRISGTGPTNWAFYQGTNPSGFAGMTTAASTPTPCGNYSTNTLNYIVAPGGNIIFRIYAWGNTPAQSAGTFRIDDVVISGTSNEPSNNFKFYTQNPIGGGIMPVAMGSEYDPMTTLGNSPQSIWVTECAPDGCESLPTEVVVTVLENPTINAPLLDPLCEPGFYNINDLDFEENPAGGVFTYHNTGMDAESGINPILTGLDNINTTRTIYVRYTLTNGCFDVDTLEVIIYPRPPAPDVPAVVNTCEGESPLIKVNVQNYAVNFTWDFEANINGEGISNNPALASNGPVQTNGTGLNSVGFQPAGSGCGNAITSAGYEVGNNSLAAAVASQEYFEFCAGMPENGILFTGITGASIRHRASGTGPISWAIVAANNLNTPLMSGTVGTGCVLNTGTFTANMETCYRVYYWGATNLSGTLRIDDFTLQAQYINNATYRFYDEDPVINPNATPVFTGDCYQTTLTVADGQTTYWVTCQNPITNCISLPSVVTAQVFPDPTITVFNSCIGGGTVTFQVTGTTGGTWSVSGGGTINPVTGVFSPTTAGCFTATYSAPGNCNDTESFVVFPAAPITPLVSNTCNTSIFVPVLPSVSGFTAQYSFNGGNTWGTINTSPSTPGCYQIVTRYILTAACGNTPAGAIGPAACQQSTLATAVIFPAAPTAPVVSNTCNTSITIPALSTVAGFRPEYSFDGGTTWTTNNVSSSIPGCYAARSRYVLAVACGTAYPAGTTAPAGCLQSPVTNVVIFPAPPVISMPAATCMTAFQLPVVTPVNNFTVEYSINGGAYTSTPTTNMTPGCYDINVRYVLSSACGTIAAGTPGPQGCTNSNTVTANVLPIPDVLDQPDILVCNLEEISPLPFTSTVSVPTCLGTSITYNWTNSNPGIGLPASGTGNIPSFTAQNPGLAVITVTPVINLNGVSCEGESVSFNIVVHQPIAMACNDNLNISVDATCSVQTFVDMFLEGTYNYFFYDVRFFIYEGVEIDINDIQLYLGTRLQYEIIDNCNGNRCWGYVTFEDKYPPVINCEDIEIICVEEPRLYIPFTEPTFIGLPQITDNCDGALDNLGMSYTQFGNGCNKTIVRRWQTYDNYGNYSNECIQTITIRPLSFAEIFAPNPLVVLPCNTPTDPNSIFAFTGNINDAFAFVVNNGETFAISGQTCNIIASYTDQIIDACGPHCHGNKKVIRTWQFIDWCEGIISLPVTQLIKSADLQGPTFILKDTTVTTSPWYCAADFDLPRPWELHDNCDINPTYYVSGPGIVQITGNPVDGYRAKGAPKGTHVFCYTASDCCGNITTLCMTVTVVDRTPPVPVTYHDIVVGLVPGGPGQDGNAKLFTEHVNNNSYDNCTDVRVEIRRPAGAPKCNNEGNIIDPVTGERYNNNVTFNNANPRLHADDNANDTDGGQFVKFCCEDLTTGVDIDGDGEVNIGYHEVIMRVWDDGDMNAVWGSIGDNYNESWIYVKVEDKAPPTIQCPPNMTIFCDWAITYSTDLGSGAQPTEGVDFTKTGLPVGYGTCGTLPIRFRDNIGQLNQCKLGNVTRDFFVGSAPVNQAPSCRQIITILPSTSQQPWVITPPTATPVATSCDGPTDAQIEANGPRWVNGPCDVIGENIKVHEFLFEDGVCKKWRVEYNYMNWCSNEARGPFFKDFMYFDQVKPEIENCDPLMFGVDANCSHRLVLTNSATDEGGCIEEGWLKWQVFVDLWADGTDDWEFSSFIPLNNDVANANNGNLAAIRDDNGNGIPDIYVAPTINGGQITITLPELIVGKMSNHKVSWKVTDGCHNHTTCHQDVMVADKKAPTPYCINVSTALMEDPDGSGPLRPMVELWAIDFNIGSFDNCTPQEDLLYTFDQWAPQVTDTVIAGRLINIDVPHYFDANGAVMGYPTTNAQVLSRYNNGELQLWLPSLRSSAKVWTDAIFTGGTNKAEVDVMMSVWDKKFNQDFCWVKLAVICNSCEDITGTRVAGLIATDQGNGVNNVEVLLYDAASSMIRNTFTNEAGLYAFDNAPSNGEIIVPVKDYDFDNGISTLDLVLIQRHILGIQAFDSPYKVVASDINNDTKINSVDLVELRKLILGTSTRFTNQSWRFIDTKYPMDMSHVFPFVDRMDIPSDSTQRNNINFVGVKIGDVNGTATTDVMNATGQNRTSATLNLTAENRNVEAGETVEVPVTASNFNEVFGFQFTMNVEGASFVNVIPGTIEINENNVGIISDEMITMSFASTTAETRRVDDVLFTIVLKANKAALLSEMMYINSNVTLAESYVGSNMKVQNIGLTVGSDNASADIQLFQNEPNPFKGQTKVSFFMPKADKATLTVYDVTGKLINIRNIDAVQGINTEVYNKEQLGTSGLLYYKLESGDFTATKKMIIIE